MVVVDIRVNVKTFLATEIIGEPCDGIFVYGDTASDFSNGGSIVVKGDVEVLPS